MPRPATGEQLRANTDGTFSKRVRLNGQKLMIHIPTLRDAAKAKERGDMLAQLAHRMSLAKAPTDVARAALERIAAQQSVSMKAACQTVDDLIAGWRPTSTCPTFATICARWNDNSLHREYPDDVPRRKESSSIRAAIATLKRYHLPSLGSKPVDMITLEDCNAIRRSLSPNLQPDSRRQILTPLKTVLDLCVHPLGLIERSPLPEGWLPSAKGPRELQWLRPAEDSKLLECTEIPLCWRVLWGFFTRNGAREEEALAMTLSQFDLGDKPAAELFAHQCKTKKGRPWSLDKTGSAEGLRRWVALQRSSAQPSDRMFVNEDGQRIIAKTVKLPELLRAHLRLAGVLRPELFESTRTSRNIVVHDLRATFVTVKMALGWTPAQIEQCTGHECASEMKRYKRQAKLLADLQAGDFVPLHEAIPELRAAVPAFACDAQSLEPLQSHAAPHAGRLVALSSVGQCMANGNAKPAQSHETAHSIVESLATSQPRGMIESAVVARPTVDGLPAISEADGRSLAALQSQINALRELVIGGFASQVADAVVTQLQSSGALPATRMLRRAK